jgi:hypothetical protein
MNTSTIARALLRPNEFRANTPLIISSLEVTQNKFYMSYYPHWGELVELA